jgi:iron complex outermembrane receptor protein
MARLRKAGVAHPERARRLRFLLLVAGIAMHGSAAWAGDVMLAAVTPNALSRLSIEELGEIEVSLVSKRPERLADAAAAVFVITREDIRRAGVSTLPEALRLAPNLQVARVNSSTYAISARGFNSESANKLLVMIDGRSVYTPLHSGVFWDAQDVMVTDIERIEVVSGPGGTLWGANAVNGVINIVTRAAQDTVGTVVSAVAGSDQRGIGARHGIKLGDDAALRFYGRSYRYGHTVQEDGTPVRDEWSRQQVGFRADGGNAAAGWTAQGDAYEGKAQVPASPDRSVSGTNLLGRYARTLDNRSGVQMQVYLDHYRRQQPGLFNEDLDTVDVDLQHHITFAGDHEVVWGGGYRGQFDRTSGNALFEFVPADSHLWLTNLYAQDTMALNPRLKLTLGLKLEHNNYTGLEYQPNARIALKIGKEGLLWSAVSRAVRIPSRLDRDFFVNIPLGAPYPGRLLGGPGFKSEKLMAYEIGYRSQPTAKLSYSVTAYYNDYRRLRSIEPNGGGDFILGNGAQGHTYGLEAWGSYQASERWRLDAGVNLLRERLGFSSGSADPGSADTTAGNDPAHQWQLRSNWSLPHDLSLDLMLRRVAALPNPAVPAYTALDARLGWTVARGVDLSIAGFNLTDARHAEFGAAPTRSELRRSVSARITWAF